MGDDEDFAEALRAAIEKRGVTLQWLHDRLRGLGRPVSVATLSYWRSGRSRPEHQTSLDALELLEELLRLPPGHLESRLGPPRRGRPIGPNSPLAQIDPRLRDALASIGYPEDFTGVREVSAHLTFDVDPDLTPRRLACMIAR